MARGQINSNISGLKMIGGGNNKQGLPVTVGVNRFSLEAIKKTAGYCKCPTNQ